MGHYEPEIPVTLDSIAWAGSEYPHTELETDLGRAIASILPKVRDALVQNVITIDKKQADYGDGNLLKWGAMGVAVRMGDKMSRIENLMKRMQNGGTPNNEALADSVLDLSAYAMIAYVIVTEIWPKHKEGIAQPHEHRM